MFQFFANIFGYLLDIINQFVNNYGLAIILFTAIIKLIMLPLSIKQQRSMKKNVELQEKLKVIQFKYKNDPEKLNKETMDLYKQEKMSPFSGCFSAIIQFILLISIFYMVRFPLTYIVPLFSFSSSSNFFTKNILSFKFVAFPKLIAIPSCSNFNTYSSFT